jgi:hypothetical protein
LPRSLVYLLVYLLRADESGRQQQNHGQRKFIGEVNWLQIEVGFDDHRHMIAPEVRLHLAMAHQ